MSDGMTDRRSQPDEIRYPGDRPSHRRKPVEDRAILIPVAPGMGANERQVGGGHYQTSAVQHWDFVEDNGGGYLEGCATKYLVRWRTKNGMQDLEKAKHYTEKLVEKSTLVGRANRGRFTRRVVEEWCLANKVDLTESVIISLLLTWQQSSDPDEAVSAELELALKLLDGLIASARKETAGLLARMPEFPIDIDPSVLSATVSYYPRGTEGMRVRVRSHIPEVNGKDGTIRQVFDAGLWLLVKLDDPVVYRHGIQVQHIDLTAIA